MTLSLRFAHRLTGLVFLSIACAFTVWAAGPQAKELSVSVSDVVLATVGPDFHGVHYDGPTVKTSTPITSGVVSMPSPFGLPASRQALQDLGLRMVRIFVKLGRVRTPEGAFDWSDTDAAVKQVTDSGMIAMLCLHQGGERDAADGGPWWEHGDGFLEWARFAGEAATRYRGLASNFEILNEPNHLHKDKADYIGWERSVELYLRAARAVRTAQPTATCGGPATWAHWESSQWAKRVLATNDGELLLDFVSYHIYTSHSATDTTADIMRKTDAFEQSASYLRRELSGFTDKRIAIMLTEYNASAVFQKDGKQFTDPRNVSGLGGIVSAMALLGSARGGCDVAVHFASIGGFGLLRWPPMYDRLPVYFAHRLLHDVAGLVPGAQVFTTQLAGGSGDSAEAPDPVAVFALANGRDQAVVFVNRDLKQGAVIRFASLPSGWGPEAELYRYTMTRIPDSLYPIERVPLSTQRSSCALPPCSITVLKSIGTIP